MKRFKIWLINKMANALQAYENHLTKGSPMRKLA